MQNFLSAASESPITFERPLPADLEKSITNPGFPRLNVALSRENPNVESSNPNMTVLQQHISFFDRNKDGIIYPWETWEGFRVMGFNLLMSLIGTFLIHLTMAIPSWDSIFYFDPFMGVLVKNIHSCKHGSDSEVYDTEGRFVPQKFEEIFSKYAKSDPEYLTLGELFCFTEGNRNVNDFFGGLAAKLEWGFLWFLVADEKGRIKKEDIRSQFDGTLFQKMEELFNQKNK